jgi:hypothetical protein
MRQLGLSPHVLRSTITLEARPQRDQADLVAAAIPEEQA